MLPADEKLSILQTAAFEAQSHLGAALMQTTDSDDKIIVDHIKAAHQELLIASRTVGA